VDARTKGATEVTKEEVKEGETQKKEDINRRERIEFSLKKG